LHPCCRHSMSPFIMNKQSKKTHIFIVCSIVSGVNTCKVQAMFLPTVVLILGLHNEDEGICVEI